MPNALHIVLLLALAAFPLSAAAQADTADSEARLEYELGRVAFEEGHFDEAARLLRHAYVLSPRFGLLYNIGQAELRAGHEALALEAFEGFLRQAPADEPTRSEVEERVRVLHGLGIEAPAPEPEVEATPLAPISHAPEVAPWIVAGIGGAVLIAGGVMLGVALLEAGRVTDAPPESHWASLQGAQSNATLFSGLGIAMLSVGAAATTLGLVWGIVANESRGEPSARLHIRPNGLLLEGTF